MLALRDCGLNYLAHSEPWRLQCRAMRFCSWCQTSRSGELRGHQCMVAMGAAICQLYHRYELQALGSAALAPSFEAWLNDVPEDEFVLADPHVRKAAAPCGACEKSKLC